MFKNILCEVEYVGSNYFGFQIQNKKKKEITVQEVIEDALEKLFSKKIRINYASRTDRGVHAFGQVINFKIDTKIPLSNIKNALNSFLPPDVKIKKIKKVPLEFHSRYNAFSKIYRYLILNKKQPSVFHQKFFWQIREKLDIDMMKKGAKKIKGKRDFSLFAKQSSNYKNCVREIKDIEIKKRGSLIIIDIEADGFLRNMARNIVSFLVRLGKKEIDLKEIDKILKKEKKYTNFPAPACGLYLLKVKYSDII
jgi:tRNA pseudouridine38-40 synthase